MSYTIALKPAPNPNKSTTTSTDGYTLTTSTPLLDSARYWLQNGANPTETITTTWSSGPGHFALRSTIEAAAKLRVTTSNIGRPTFSPVNDGSTAKDEEI